MRLYELRNSDLTRYPRRVVAGSNVFVFASVHYINNAVAKNSLAFNDWLTIACWHSSKRYVQLHEINYS